MKHFIFMLIAVFAMAFSPPFAQQNSDINTDTINVNGACGMCKSRIEKNLKMEGISSSNWNKETKRLIVSYNPGKITNDAIQKKIASVGHDTEKYGAEDSTYEKLPGCCHYERTAEVPLAEQTNFTERIHVNGACGMCKSRIQKALKIDGISAATWDTETKLLTVTYNPKTVSNDNIQNKVAAVGHDTDKYQAEDKVYDKLPGCCR